MAKRSGGVVREGRRRKLLMADVEGIGEVEGGVVLVCLRKEGATDGGVTMAGWLLRAIVDTSDRSRGRMDREIA